MGMKIMDCKLLITCCKEEVPAGVFTVASQCIEGTTVSWVAYFLNLFLDEYKDARDLGTKFHY
jgi:hypothetical protein